MSKNSTKFNPSDILGAIRLEASRIVMAVDHFVAGASFPDASAIQAVIDRQSELNSVLLGIERTIKAQEAEARASEGLVARGTDAVN